MATKTGKTSVKLEKLKKGYPLGRGGKRVTKDPPQTKRALTRGNISVDEARARSASDSAQIQYRLQIEKELGLRNN